MVECSINLDTVFSSLADATRRDILRRVSRRELSISTLAHSYRISFAAIAKHVSVLESARLVTKRREGKQQIVSVIPQTFHATQKHLEKYEALWNARYDALDTLLKK